jgi:hypothetical protein
MYNLGNDELVSKAPGSYSLKVSNETTEVENLIGGLTEVSSPLREVDVVVRHAVRAKKQRGNRYLRCIGTPNIFRKNTTRS